MEVRFASRPLERRYLAIHDAERAWGEAVARRYVQRVDVLREAPDFASLYNVRALRIHPLKGERQGEHALTLSGRWRLIVRRLSDTSVLIREVTRHYGD